MKIAITADLHLTTADQHPARFHAFENILDQMVAREIACLIVAGDLFDETASAYTDFEEILRRPAYAGLSLHVIPGNHDPNLKRAHFGVGDGAQLHVYAEPQVVSLDPDGPPFLFLPYRRDRTAGEELAAARGSLTGGHWVLVAHGDWLEGRFAPNPAEDGTYMPLTQRDLEIFKPEKAFLGHIHLPWEHEPVYYPGSPCGLDVSESGPRSFLIFDSASRKVERVRVETDFVFCDLSLVVLPLPDELDWLRAQIEQAFTALGATPREKVILRVKLCGGSTNKQDLLDALRQSLAGCAFYHDQFPNLSDVHSAESSEVAALARAVTERIDAIPWDLGPDGPSRAEILAAAFQTIYGG